MKKSIVISIFLFVVDLWLSVGNDYYEILGVSRTADLKEIRKAFKKLAVTEHPDKNNDNPIAHEKFILLTRAYETLKDPILRKKYDNYGEEGLDILNKEGAYHAWNYFGLYDNDPWIITLDKNDYFENVIYAEKIWLVNFYSPLCGHCHKLAPVWKKVAEDLNGAVRIGAVNCEDERQLCREIGIQSYPTLIYYSKNSKYGVRFTGEKTYAAIMDFILNRLEVYIHEIDEPLESFILRGSNETTKSVLIFVCGVYRNCFTSTDRFKIAATLENIIDVRIFFCDREEKCKNVVDSQDASVIYLSVTRNNSWHIVPFRNIENAKILLEKILGHLLESYDLDANEFQSIRKYLVEEETSHFSWLLCFYIGNITELNAMLKKLITISSVVKLGKINCGKHSHICSTFGINRYPMWGIFKRGGGFEFYHGENIFKDIVKFVHDSVKALNVWALNEEQVTSILQGKVVNEIWFLDWYVPWCPPCMHFLKEFRKASMEFHKSIVRFGTIDCTIHSMICHRQNIRSYPTVILVNGTSIHKFLMQKTAANIVQFINEARNPTVIRLSSNNFEDQLGQRKDKFIWVVGYFSAIGPLCASCQRLISEWITVANSLSILPFMKVASIDCEMEFTLCTLQRIHSYPMIRIYSNEDQDLTTFVSYNGQRDSISILRWITRFFPRKVRNLNPSTLKREVLSDNNIWIVDFFVPWCEHCRKLEPQVAIVAQLLEKIQFGRFNCDTYVAECTNAGIKLYPTLIAYDSRYREKKIANGFEIDGIKAESIKRSVLDFVAHINHDEL